MSNIVYGYIRVSTKEQNEDRQRIALAEFSVPEENIFISLVGKILIVPNIKNLCESFGPVTVLSLNPLTGLGEIMRRF